MVILNISKSFFNLSEAFLSGVNALIEYQYQSVFFNAVITMSRSSFILFEAQCKAIQSCFTASITILRLFCKSLDKYAKLVQSLFTLIMPIS